MFRYYISNVYQMFVFLCSRPVV